MREKVARAWGAKQEVRFWSRSFSTFDNCGGLERYTMPDNSASIPVPQLHTPMTPT